MKKTYTIRRFSFQEISESSSWSSEEVNGKPVHGHSEKSVVRNNNGHITGKRRLKRFSSREVVPKRIAEEGRKSGVVQKKPSGKWGIISYKQNPPEFWNADYESKSSAEAALRGYQANK